MFCKYLINLFIKCQNSCRSVLKLKCGWFRITSLLLKVFILKIVNLSNLCQQDYLFFPQWRWMTNTALHFPWTNSILFSSKKWVSKTSFAYFGSHHIFNIPVSTPHNKGISLTPDWRPSHLTSRRVGANIKANCGV